MSEYIYTSQGEPLANERGEISLAREEIVRCRDCEYARHYHPFCMGERSPIEEWYCQWHSNAEGASEIEPNGYCAWAMPKAGARS